MRGLLPDEHAMLSLMVREDDAPGFAWNEDDPDGERWSMAHDSLLARGCVSMVTIDDPDDEEFEIDRYSITALGRLALRVSTVAMGR